MSHVVSTRHNYRELIGSLVCLDYHLRTSFRGSVRVGRVQRGCLLEELCLIARLCLPVDLVCADVDDPLDDVTLPLPEDTGGEPQDG